MIYLQSITTTMKHLGSRIFWLVAAVLAIVMLSSSYAFASIEDKVLKFSSPGPDCYADGTVVADGECYALVWSPKGSNFAGFNADGTPVSSADRVVLAASLAHGGRCRDAVFQVPAEEYAELEGGEWAVCLVDTRKMNGVPAGAKDGMPLRVNRWGVVNGGVKESPASISKLKLASSSGAKSDSTTGGTRSGASDGGTAVQPVRANRLSAVPPDLAPPRITAIEVGDGEVWLAVEGTAPYLNYTIISGETPNNLKDDYFSEVVEGDDGGEIAIGTVQSVKRRFFKVKRAE